MKVSEPKKPLHFEETKTYLVEIETSKGERTVNQRRIGIQGRRMFESGYCGQTIVHSQSLPPNSVETLGFRTS